MDIKSNLKKARKERRLTQDEMAEKLGMTRQAYCNMENGKTELVNKKMYKIAEMFDVNIESLILGYSSAGDVQALTEQLSRSVQDISRLVKVIDEMSKAMNNQREHIKILKQIQNYILGYTPDDPEDPELKEIVERRLKNR